MSKYDENLKAVFPLVGRGIRFLPATKAMPMEMLPVVDKPIIQYELGDNLRKRGKLEFLKEQPVFGCKFNGTRFDCGDKAGFQMANLAFALEHPEIKDALREHIENTFMKKKVSKLHIL